MGTLSENYKKELNRNQLNSLGTDGIRRELSIELDKQRVDFEEQKRCELNEQQKRFEL